MIKDAVNKQVFLTEKFKQEWINTSNFILQPLDVKKLTLQIKKINGYHYKWINLHPKQRA